MIKNNFWKSVSFILKVPKPCQFFEGAKYWCKHISTTPTVSSSVLMTQYNSEQRILKSEQQIGDQR